MDVKLVCFDLDDTLIRGIHSVMLPCILNGKEREHALIQEKEERGTLDYITADHCRAELLAGLEEEKIAAHFLRVARPLLQITETVAELHDHGIGCIVVTVGPVQVARVVAELYGFDGYYGSHYEVIDGRFTGRILNYITAEGKTGCLLDYCRKHRIDSANCVSVGDGGTDIPVFGLCGASVAINASDRVKEKATYCVDTDNCMDILPFIL